MNTKSSPSLYRYCMSRLSTLAVSTFTPALNVRSTTLPESTFLSLVRTKAPPLPGLTCWNSTTVQSWPSKFSTSPFFRSLVVATVGLPARLSRSGGATRLAGMPAPGGARGCEPVQFTGGPLPGRPGRPGSARQAGVAAQQRAAEHPDRLRPDQRSQGADHEPLRASRVLPQLRVPAETLDGHDDRDRRWVAEQQDPGDGGPFQHADPGAAAQHGPCALAGRPVASGVVRLGRVIGCAGVTRAGGQAEHRCRQRCSGGRAERQGTDSDERDEPRVHLSPSVNRRAATGRAATSSAHIAARRRWLTACWLTPRCFATASWVASGPSASNASITAQPAGLRRVTRAPSKVSTDSASRARSGTSPSTASGTGRLRLLARSTAALARTNAGPEPARALAGNGSSTSPTPIPTLHASVRNSRRATSTTRVASSNTACTSSPTVRSKARTTPSRPLSGARSTSNASTRSPTRRLACWSMVRTNISQGYDPVRSLSLIHISEPTRLGMISYAVFCLKKKKKTITKTLSKTKRQKNGTETTLRTKQK